jgi:outer membrane protein assembly factor BamB
VSAFDRGTGRRVWQYELAAEAPFPAVHEKHNLASSSPFVVDSSAGVSGHDAATGERLWHFEETNRFPIPVPLFHDGLVYMSRAPSWRFAQAARGPWLRASSYGG